MKKSLILLSILGLVGCSSGGGGDAAAIPGSELPPLSADQKGRVVAVSGDMAAVGSAAETHSNRPSSDGFTPLGLTTNSKELSEKGTKIKNKMDTAINFGECAVQTKPDFDNTTQPLENQEFEMIISHGNSGSQCPIFYSTSFSMLQSPVSNGSSASMSLKMNMEFRAEEGSDIYDILDVTDYNLDFTANIAIQGQGETAAVFNVQAEGNGTIISKSEGSVDISATVSGNGTMSADQNTGASNTSMNMSLTASLAFQDFKVTGHQKISMISSDGSDSQVTVERFINGQPATQEEFNEIFQEDLFMEVAGGDELGITMNN